MDTHKGLQVSGMRYPYNNGWGGAREGRSLAQTGNQDVSGGAQSGVTFDTTVTPGWFTFSAGNLTVTASGVQTAHSGFTRLTGSGKSSGKWYLEFVCNARNSTNNDTGGVALVTSTVVQGVTSLAFNTANLEKAVEYAWNGWTGRYDTTNGFVAYRTVHAATNVIQMAVDITNKKMWWGLNNTWQGGGDPAAATSPSVTWTNAGTWWPAVYLDEGATGARPGYSVRVSPGSLSYSIPTGFTLYA